MTRSVVPVTSSQVTEEWLEGVIKCNVKDARDVKVLKLDKLKDARGRTSSFFKCRAKVSKINGSEEEELLKMFVKVMPDDEEAAKFIRDEKVDATELEAYQRVLPDLVEFEETLFGKEDKRLLARSLPKFIAGDVDLSKDPSKRGFYLILEDVSDLFEVTKLFYHDFTHLLFKPLFIFVECRLEISIRASSLTSFAWHCRESAASLDSPTVSASRTESTTSTSTTSIFAGAFNCQIDRRSF